MFHNELFASLLLKQAHPNSLNKLRHYRAPILNRPMARLVLEYHQVAYASNKDFKRPGLWDLASNSGEGPVTNINVN